MTTRTLMTALALLAVAGAAQAQGAFPATQSEARLSQRSSVTGQGNLDQRRDVIRQSAYATTPQPGALNPLAQSFLENQYGPGPVFSYDKAFVNQFAYGHGRDNQVSMTYSGRDDDGEGGQGGIDKKLIVAEQIAIQRGDGNVTHLSGDIRQTGRPLGAGLHGDLVDINLDVATQVGVQIGNGNDLTLDLTTEQTDR
jgi:hypothetical protein